MEHQRPDAGASLESGVDAGTGIMTIGSIGDKEVVLKATEKKHVNNSV